MNKPDLVFFDLGDVTCRFVPDARCKAFASHTGLSEDEVHELIWGSGLSSACDQGHYDLDGMHQAINAKLRTDLDLSTTMDLWRRAFITDEQVYEIAQEVGEAAQIGMFTNNAPMLRSALPIWFTELERLFDPIVFSYELGAAKPAPASFQKIQELTGLAPDRLMLIDDSTKNVDAALACDWHAIRFLGPSALRGSLQEFSLL